MKTSSEQQDYREELSRLSDEELVRIATSSPDEYRPEAIVAAKATPEESAAFSEWLVVTAQAAADAAKEGGFMGFGAEQVSQGEKDMLDQVRSAVGVG